MEQFEKTRTSGVFESTDKLEVSKLANFKN